MARPIDAERIERKLQLDISHCSGGFNKAVLSMFRDYIKSAPTLTSQAGPLTPEQLLEMDGSPVWIKSESVWGLVQAWDLGLRKAEGELQGGSRQNAGTLSLSADGG